MKEGIKMTQAILKKEFLTPDDLGALIGKSGSFVRQNLLAEGHGFATVEHFMVGNRVRINPEIAIAFAEKHWGYKPMVKMQKAEIKTETPIEEKLTAFRNERDNVSPLPNADWINLARKHYPVGALKCELNRRGCRLLICEQKKTGFLVANQSTSGPDHFVNVEVINESIRYLNCSHHLRISLVNLIHKVVFEAPLLPLLIDLKNSGIKPSGDDDPYFIIDDEGNWVRRGQS